MLPIMGHLFLPDDWVALQKRRPRGWTECAERGRQEEASLGGCWLGEGGAELAGGTPGSSAPHLCGLGHSEPRAQHSPLHPQPLRGASLGPATDLEDSCFVWILFILPSHFGHTCRKTVTCSKGKQESMSASGQAATGVWSEARGQRLGSRERCTGVPGGGPSGGCRGAGMAHCLPTPLL